MKYILALLFSVILFSARAETPTFMSKKSPEEGLQEALEYYDIHHKEIVYAQAVLETGHFKSRGCKRGNNLFGLRGNKGYHKYSHWSESVKAYKEKIQSRYKPGEDYYKFLKRIHYAEAQNYTTLLKSIVKKKPWECYMLYILKAFELLQYGTENQSKRTYSNILIASEMSL